MRPIVGGLILASVITATSLRADPPPPPAFPTTGPADVVLPAQETQTPPGPPMPAEAFGGVDSLTEYRPRWKLLAGGGFDLAIPFVQNNRAFTAVMPSGGQTVTTSTDFGNPLAVAPRFWLGVVMPNGWGFRTSYWHFDQTQNLTTALDGSSPTDASIFSASPLGVGIGAGTFLLAPGNSDVLATSGRLNVTSLDFELTKEIDAGRMFLLFSGGARYARVAQSYDATVTNTANDFFTNAQVDQLHSFQRFVGGGPTLALQGWYPLGQSSFSIYAKARGTLLIGSTRLFADASRVQVANGMFSDASLGNVSACHNLAVPVGELELGMQWSRSFGRFLPFLRVGVNGQTWFNAFTSNTVSLGNGDSANLNSNLSFFGVTFQAGLNY
jgi:hypothetical protein